LCGKELPNGYIIDDEKKAMAVGQNCSGSVSAEKSNN